MPDRRIAAISALEAAIGHVFADRALLEAALTHSSVADGSKKTIHNERLEFLGDRVLGLVAAEHLLHSEPSAREGQMSPHLAALVNGRTCAAVARKLGVGAALRLAAFETASGGRDKDTILGDACEAIMAAVYLDGGLEAARGFFQRAWSDEIADDYKDKDSKTRLQEWAQGQGRPLPAYEVVSREGPDHAPRFVVRVMVEGYAPRQAEGNSRRAAEKAAAEALLAEEADK